MSRNGSLEFKYENYEDDIHNKNQDFNMQTDLADSRKKTQKSPPKKQPQEEQYANDFEQEKPSPKLPAPTFQQKQESEQDEPNKFQKLMPNISQREKLIEQNIKLKTQIYELAKQMDEILLKDKARRKKYGMSTGQEDDEVLRAKKLELKKQQIEIMELKNKIFVVKRQLENVYDNRGILSKEDELKNLKGELKALEDQKEALLRVKKEQTKALKVIKNQEEYQERIDRLREQLSKVKQESKILNEKLMENQRTLRKNHEQYIIKQTKIKEMEQKLAQNKQKEKVRKVQPIVTPEMIAELEQEIANLQKQKRESDRHWQQKIHNVDNELHQRRLEEEKKLLILKEKQKELKLNEIRIKELRKLIRHNALESIKKNTEEPDPKEFRHRRNIKYVEK